MSKLLVIKQNISNLSTSFIKIRWRTKTYNRQVPIAEAPLAFSYLTLVLSN